MARDHFLSCVSRGTAWVLVENIIDLDNDWAELWIDGTMAHEFKFSNQAYEEGGTLQLGGADFWAGGPDGDPACGPDTTAGASGSA